MHHLPPFPSVFWHIKLHTNPSGNRILDSLQGKNVNLNSRLPVGEEGDTNGARAAKALAFSLSVFRKYHQGHVTKSIKKADLGYKLHVFLLFEYIT